MNPTYSLDTHSPCVSIVQEVKMVRECAICGDEFDTRARRAGFQYANRCNDCNDHDDAGRETIQQQTESLINAGQAARAARIVKEGRK